MRELERASADPRGWQNSSGGSLAMFWWAAYLIDSIYRWFTRDMLDLGEDTEELVELSYYQIKTSTMHLILCIVAFLLIARIAKDQRKLVE